MGLSRRRFLKQTITAAAACGLARPVAADDTQPQSITDTHVYLGHWPHRRLPSDNPPKLVADLRRSGVTQAWVGSFDGLFHKDIAGVNQRLAEMCAQVGDRTLIPFGTINPTLPDWEDDIRRCHESFHMPGVRLHPNYHGYTLDDPRFTRLLELATTRGLIVQLTVWMEPEQHFLLNPQITTVNMKPLPEQIAAFPKLKLLVANAYRSTDDDALSSLLPLKPVHFDFAGAENARDIRILMEKSSSDRIVFGSGLPLNGITPVIVTMKEAQLTEGNLQAVTMKNASRLIATGKTR